MRKIYVITLLALLGACNMFAATVKVTMNAVSTTMSLVDKTTGTTVETGEPASKVYTFETPAGTYVLTAYATDGTTVNGTIELNVTADQMASGEVAYKLGEAFGQEIGKDALPVLGGMVVLYDEATGVYYNEKEPEEKDYELRVLTFEDADYKAGVNFAGGNDWSSLIDDPQYGGALLYGESGMGVSEKADAYNWYDKDNTELSSILVNGWGSWCYWTGGHAVSNYGSSDIETYGGYNSQLTIYNKEAGEGIVRKGMGHNGSDNFAVHYGYHDNSGYSADEVPVLSFKDGVARVIDHMYVTNTCYALNCYMEGNGLTANIGDDDWVKIVATGDNGKVAEFYLCNGPKNIVTDWTKWDLSELGEVTSVQFNVTGSSDNGYGFSQPAYFAYDDVAVRFPLAESVAVADFENSDEILVDATGVFRPEDEESETCYWNSGDYTFTTYTDDWGKKFYYDFVVTNSKSDKYEAVSDQYNSAAAGAKSGDNYAVWYNNFYGSEGIYMPEAMQLSGFYVTNTAWVVDALMNGDTMSVEDDGTKGMPFGYGGKKDKLTLVITGYNEEMEETGKVEYTLAENDDEKLYYVKDWRWVDLTELGTDVINVQFAIESTKQNDYGPTTPMYFCMDDFGGKAPATDAEMVVVDLSTLAIRNVNSTNANVQRYDLMGRLAGKGKGIQIVRKGSKVRKTFNVR